MNSSNMLRFLWILLPLIYDSLNAIPLEPNPDPNEKLNEEFLEKNQDFTNHVDHMTLLKTSSEQHPKLYWIGCSDSRVPESLIVEAKIGEIFVHRNVGNIYDPKNDETVSGMAYAINHLNITDIVVVGHEGCGACTSALDAAYTDLKIPNNSTGSKKDSDIGEESISHWILPIKQLAKQILNQIINNSKPIPTFTKEEKSKQLSKLVASNVQQQVKNILDSEILKAQIDEDRSLMINGWIYDLASGKIKVESRIGIN